MDQPQSAIGDDALRLRLRNGEHDFVERKSAGKQGDWLQTAVAFANSAPIGWPAVLFVGVDDSGAPQQSQDKLESLAKSVTATIGKAYPPIYFYMQPLHLETGSCLAVVIPGSAERPHFAGQAYVRTGPETKSASAAQFAEMIAAHTSKAREVLKWKDKRITYVNRAGEFEAIVAECTAHWVSLNIENQKVCLPLAGVTLTMDRHRDRLQISYRA